MLQSQHFTFSISWYSKLGGYDMTNLDIDYINTKLLEKGDRPFKLVDLEYPEVRTDGHHLLDKENNPV